MLHDVYEFLFADKDECALGINNCNPETSICVNTLGSYVCYCKEGFVLGADGRTCEGRNGAHVQLYTIIIKVLQVVII